MAWCSRRGSRPAAQGPQDRAQVPRRRRRRWPRPAPSLHPCGLSRSRPGQNHPLPRDHDQGEPHDQHPHLRPGDRRRGPARAAAAADRRAGGRRRQPAPGAADLPQPRYIAVFDPEQISMQFAPTRPALRAITRWARRFGGVVTSEARQRPRRPETWCRTKFSYYGVAVTGLRPHPGRTRPASSRPGEPSCTTVKPSTRVATDIAEWQTAAQQLPLPELPAMVATWQNSLAESLNDFNDQSTPATTDGDESADASGAIGEVVRRATAMAIFALGIAQRAAPGGAPELTHSAGPGGRPSPGPASQNHPLPREKQRSFGMLNATSGMPARVVLDWRHGTHRPAGTVRAVRQPGAEPVPGQGRALPQGLRRDLDHRPRPRRR